MKSEETVHQRTSQSGMFGSSYLFQKSIIALGLIYLLIPNVLFLMGWFKWYIAVPISLGITAAAYTVWNKMSVRPVQYARKDWLCLLLTLAGCFILTEMISFHGHALQMSDFFVRNPIYDTLIASDWPIYNFRGEYFVYYFSYWLFPALVSKCLPVHANPQTVLFVWSWAGLGIAFSCFFLRAKSWVLPFFIFLFLVGSLMDWINFSGGDIWNYLPANDCMANFRALNGFVSAIRYIPWPAEIMQTFNHAIPIWLAICLFLCGRIKWLHLPFIGAMVISASPLGGVSLLVILLLRLRSHLIAKKDFMTLTKEYTVWVAVALLIPVACFFRMSPGSSATFMMNSARHACLTCWGSFLCYAINVLILLLPALFLVRRRLLIRNSMFLSFIFLAAFTPLLWIGVDNNELMYKAGAVLYPCLAWCFLQRFRTATTRVRVIVLVCLLLSSGNVVYRTGKILLSYSWDAEKMRQNRIADQECSLKEGSVYGTFVRYERFWTTKELPFFFLRTEGESAQGLLKPFSTGVKASQRGVKYD